MRPTTLLLVLLLLATNLALRIGAALLLGLTLPAIAQDSVLRGKPYSIHLDFRDDATARQARQLAAATWEFALQYLRPDPKARERAKFEVHVYRTAADYHAAGERLGSPHHENALGFADSRSGSCHLLIELDESLPGLAPLAQRMLVHECMHLAIYASNPGAMFLPEWYAEGVPLWAEAEVLLRHLGLQDIDDVVCQGHYGSEAKQMLAKGRLPTVQAVMAGELAEWDRLERYIVFGQLCRVLAGRGDLWRRLWVTSTTMRGPAVAASLRDLVAADLAGGLPAMDAEWRAYVGKRNEPVVKSDAAPRDAKGKAGEAGFVPGSPRVAWFERQNRRELEIAANVTLRASSAPQADVVFDRGGDRWLRVTVYGGHGVHVSERAADGTWHELGAWLAPADVPVEAPVALRIVVRAGKLDVEVGRKRVLALTPVELDVRGRWGFGGPTGARTAWSDVRVRN